MKFLIGSKPGECLQLLRPTGQLNAGDFSWAVSFTLSFFLEQPPWKV